MKQLRLTHEISEATAAAFVARVEACGGSDIEVLIDCPGGEPAAAFTMANALHAAKGHTTALLLRADSAALFVSLGADLRVAAKDGSCVLHQPTIEVPYSFSVTARDLRTAAENTEQLQRNLCRALEMKTGTSASWWGTLMNRNTRLAAERMLEYRLVDEISPWSKAYLLAQFYSDGRADRAANKVAAFIAPTIKAAFAAKTSPRSAKVIDLGSANLAASARLHRGTLNRLRRAHMLASDHVPTYPAHTFEREPCCLIGKFEGMAEQQLRSVEGMLREPGAAQWADG